MDTQSSPARPFFALISDNAQSARVLTRMLTAHGAPTVCWLLDPEDAATTLGDILADPCARRPGLVIVDLRSSSTREFISRIRRLEGAGDLLIVAMAPSLDLKGRNVLLEAGAKAVFQRQVELDPYRREAASIVSFWVRNERLNAIGA